MRSNPQPEQLTAHRAGSEVGATVGATVGGSERLDASGTVQLAGHVGFAGGPMQYLPQLCVTGTHKSPTA